MVMWLVAQKPDVKEAIAAVLIARLPVFKNRANYNGIYGLPIAIGELLPEQRVAVLEMAADHFGEMARLCAIAPPHVAVVTTVEPAHLETLALEAIAREKAAKWPLLTDSRSMPTIRVLGMAARCVPGVQV
jgi:UDP-N-acetylmuramoyl-tripeptide--D-alanyl-D-alanine ligase